MKIYYISTNHILHILATWLEPSVSICTTQPRLEVHTIILSIAELHVSHPLNYTHIVTSSYFQHLGLEIKTQNGKQ